MTLLMAGINMSQCCPHKCHFEYLKARETGPERRSMTSEYETLKYAIYNNLGVGPKNAVSRKELCRRTGCGDRMLRRAIEDLRKDRVIITDDNGAGYYIPTTDASGKAQAAYWIARQSKRLKSIKKAMKGAERFVKQGGDKK